MRNNEVIIVVMISSHEYSRSSLLWLWILHEQ